MPRSDRRINAIGFYIAIALVLYALIGALTNDLYIPGRRGRGLHLHHEAIPPAMLGIILFALTFPLSHFRESIWLAHIRLSLSVGAVLSILLSVYLIVQPTGRRLASIEECQATFLKIENYAAAMDGDSRIRELFQQRGSECATRPVLKSFHACVARAKRPEEANGCQGEAEALFKERNTSSRRRFTGSG
jgi:hypothetical protein